MADYQLVDPQGRPVRKSDLTSELAAATIGGVRSPITGYPADGLNPMTLADILRDADAGNALRYLELAETIEERDAHYIGVLGTRRRSVSQIDITVDAASDDPTDEAIAQDLRAWIKRDELTEELFDILDCIGKGYSVTEIIWDHSEGQWQPIRLEYRDPRWFRFARTDLKTPMLIADGGTEVPLAPFKFIFAQIRAKSGLALRSGIARIAAWGWMFKAYTQRDWAIFTQTYGQPIRLGKFGAGATEEDKAKLFRAVANIAGDCAAIIPESMQIEFVEAGNIGAAHQLYKERADWLDQQISKAVLGQTATTDAVVGGLGSGKEHRAVQKDIQTADARALAAILNRDLVRPFVQLNYGPQKAYPRLRIEETEQEDLVAFSSAVVPLIDRGFRVGQAAIRTKFSLAEPKADEPILTPTTGAAPQNAPAAAPGMDPAAPVSDFKRESGVFKRVEPNSGVVVAPQAEGPSTGEKQPPLPSEQIADRLAADAAPAVELMITQIETMLEAATDLEEFREMLMAAFPKLDAGPLAAVLGQAMSVANATGRAEVGTEGG